MNRPGQSHETSSCGALMAALERFSGDEVNAPYIPFARDDDAQQVLLERTLMPYKTRILAAASPEKEITEITCGLVHQQVHSLIDATRSQFCGSSIVFAGGLIINTDADQEDWVDLRYSGVVELQPPR